MDAPCYRCHARHSHTISLSRLGSFVRPSNAPEAGRLVKCRDDVGPAHHQAACDRKRRAGLTYGHVAAVVGTVISPEVLRRLASEAYRRHNDRHTLNTCGRRRKRMFQPLAIAAGIAAGAAWVLTSFPLLHAALLIRGLASAVGACTLSGQINVGVVFLPWDLSHVIITAVLTAWVAWCGRRHAPAAPLSCWPTCTQKRRSPPVSKVSNSHPLARQQRAPRTV